MSAHCTRRRGAGASGQPAVRPPYGLVAPSGRATCRMLSYAVAGGALPQPIRREGTHMGHQPPSGSPPIPPERPPSPAAPLPAPDRVARLALAGFRGGLARFLASILPSH